MSDNQMQAHEFWVRVPLAEEIDWIAWEMPITEEGRNRWLEIMTKPAEGGHKRYESSPIFRVRVLDAMRVARDSVLRSGPQAAPDLNSRKDPGTSRGARQIVEDLIKVVEVPPLGDPHPGKPGPSDDHSREARGVLLEMCAGDHALKELFNGSQSLSGAESQGLTL